MGLLAKKIIVGACVGFVALLSTGTASAQIDLPTKGYERDWPIQKEFVGCADLIVKSIPGTWETSADMSPLADAGLLGSFNAKVRDIGSKLNVSVDAKIVPYPAKFGGIAAPITKDVMPYPVSRNIGVENTIKALAEDMARCPDSKFVVSGFSQGADIAGDVMEQIAQGEADGVDIDKIVASFIYADPKRTPSTEDDNGVIGDITRTARSERLVSNENVKGGGITGMSRDFGEAGKKIYTFCLDGDAVCALPQDAGKNTGAFAALMGIEDSKTVNNKSYHADSSADVISDNGIIDPFEVITWVQNFVVRGGLTPQDIATLGSLTGTHSTVDGHVGYGVQKVAPGDKTPIQWGAEAAVAKVLKAKSQG